MARKLWKVTCGSLVFRPESKTKAYSIYLPNLAGQRHPDRETQIAEVWVDERDGVGWRLYERVNLAPEPTYITEIDMPNDAQPYYNRRTGEVLLSHSEEAVGKVWKDAADSSWRARLYEQHGEEPERFAREQDAVQHLIKVGS